MMLYREETRSSPLPLPINRITSVAVGQVEARPSGVASGEARNAAGLSNEVAASQRNVDTGI